MFPPDRIPGFVAHLENPAEFKRAHRIPALSADDPDYSGTGGYWCGGVWAPTNYMVLKGLDDQRTRCSLLMRSPKITWRMSFRFFNQTTLPGSVRNSSASFFTSPILKYDDNHTLWENYAPDVIRPGSHSKPGYVGWTGVPPMAVLLEDVFGLSPDAVSNRLTWHVRLTEEHGVRRYPFGQTGLLDLKCHSRNSRLDRPLIEIHSNLPLTLEVIWEGGTDSLNVEKDV